MEATLIRASNLVKNKWSGGTTTELFIFPKNANYQERNFDFRLSTATVETEQSVFTLLPGFNRKLMVLQGQVILNHENEHSKQLNKFEVDTFNGAWKTTSLGKCTDFNLMTSEKTSGDVRGMSLKKNESTHYLINQEMNWLFIYAFKGMLRFEIKDETLLLKAGDLLVLRAIPLHALEIKCLEDSEWAFCTIIE